MWTEGHSCVVDCEGSMGWRRWGGWGEGRGVEEGGVFATVQQPMAHRWILWRNWGEITSGTPPSI